MKEIIKKVEWKFNEFGKAMLSFAVTLLVGAIIAFMVIGIIMSIRDGQLIATIAEWSFVAILFIISLFGWKRKVRYFIEKARK